MSGVSADCIELVGLLDEHHILADQNIIAPIKVKYIIGVKFYLKNTDKWQLLGVAGNFRMLMSIIIVQVSNYV